MLEVLKPLQVANAAAELVDVAEVRAPAEVKLELLKAYKANAPEVVEAKEDPFYAPQLKAVMGSVRDALLKAKGGVDVLTSLINIVVVFMSSIKGPVLATDGAAQCPTMCRIASTLILAYRSHHLCSDGVACVAHRDEPAASVRHIVP